MKVIFLDIDGVLNCARTHNPRRLPYVIDPRLKKHLDGLLERTGAKIVLTSTWRHDPAAMFTLRRSGIRCFDVVPDLPSRPRSRRGARLAEEGGPDRALRRHRRRGRRARRHAAVSAVVAHRTEPEDRQWRREVS